MGRLVFGALVLLAALAVIAGEGDKPRWMQPEQGFIVEESGAKVESVTEDKEKAPTALKFPSRKWKRQLKKWW
jgi:hypothetical protein